MSKRKHYHRRRRSNPVTHYHRRRRSNPLGFNTSDALGYAIYGGIGAVGTRALPSMLLGSKDTGIMGYGADLVAAVGLSAIAKAVKPDAAGKVFGGGIIALTLRIIGDYAPSLPGMSGFINSNFPLPSIDNGQGVSQYPALLGPATVSVPGGGSSGVSSGRGMGRFGRR